MDKDRGEANIQDAFLARARKERSVIAVVLTGGKRLTGRIRSFDRYALILEDRGGEQMIFKHAIATIAVARAFNNSIRFSRPGEAGTDEGGSGGTPPPEGGPSS